MATRSSKPRCAETIRLIEDGQRTRNWKRWGPYLAERQWGTVREDYSPDGSCWTYFPHDHARSRAYRWGEDGILGLCDRECRLCFALAMWNGRDPILKERLFGLTGPEGNHGEDVKEAYFYLDATPTGSYLRGLYKYPQAEFPYERLVREGRRSRHEAEFELADAGVFDASRYFDVEVEYAKASPDDLLIRVNVSNRGPARATLQLLPTLWFRNTWSWGCTHEGCEVKPWMRQAGEGAVEASHATLGRWLWEAAPFRSVRPPLLFTENESNLSRLYGVANAGPHVKDAIDAFVVRGQADAVNPERQGTKAAAHYVLDLDAGESVALRLRLRAEGEGPGRPFAAEFDRALAARRAECDEFYARRIPRELSEPERKVARQAYAGLLWSRQFYHLVVRDWLDGDPLQPAPPASRRGGRNSDWPHLFNRDVISMPDKWEYPWYAAWDLAFHMLPMARVDPQFACDQLLLLLREWYMHPNGQIPAYEFAFGDVNPPVHAWACWRVYKLTGPRGRRDRRFLARAFQKLLINFTWWVNRKDVDGKHIFAGGFLGLDNIGLFDRSRPLPGGGRLEQADGTAWMAFYCVVMLSMALELAQEDPVYEDVASKFFEHFVAIVDAMNTLGGSGLWDELDGFYYDLLHLDHHEIRLRIRSMVGVIPLFACEVLEERSVRRLRGFSRRMDWFLRNRPDLSRHISFMTGRDCDGEHGRFLLAVPSQPRLERVLRYLVDEREFLSPFGVRSLSAAHAAHPYTLRLDGQAMSVRYTPGESETDLFGGNSNWRGPIWFPTNYLLIESLHRYHHFYGDGLSIECPAGSGQAMTLAQIATELETRLVRLFLPDEHGRRPCHGSDPRFCDDPHWKDLILFHEYFHGDDGRGLGASHQTGWTALVARCLEKLAARRSGREIAPSLVTAAAAR